MTLRPTDDTSPPDIPRGTETVLIVDDDEGPRSTAARVLTRLGYTVLSARDGEEGLDVFARHGEKISLVMLDIVMPRMSGPEMYDALRRAGADVPVLFQSGTVGAYDTRHDRPTPLLEKPWTAKALARTVRKVLDGEL